MRVLLTGGTGFLGRTLRRMPEGHDFTLLGREPVRETALKALLERQQIQAILHLATHYRRHPSAEDLVHMRQCNVEFGQRILAAAQGLPLWFINVGSAWQHWNDHNFYSYNAYAESKQEFFRLLGASGIAHIELKLFDTYGPGDTRPRLLPLLLRAALTQQEVRLGHPEQRVQYTHSEDVARGFHQAFALVAQGEVNSGAEYALTSGYSLSLAELVSLVAEITGQKLSVSWDYSHPPEGRPWSRYEKLPGDYLRVNLTKGLKDLWGTIASEQIPGTNS